MSDSSTTIIKELSDEFDNTKPLKFCKKYHLNGMGEYVGFGMCLRYVEQQIYLSSQPKEKNE